MLEHFEVEAKINETDGLSKLYVHNNILVFKIPRVNFARRIYLKIATLLVSNLILRITWKNVYILPVIRRMKFDTGGEVILASVHLQMEK